jgi:hypothetical protein
MDPQALELEKEYQQEVPPPIFDTECAIKLQEFEWLFVQCHIPKEASPAWTKAYNCSGFANSEQRLFVVGNYKFYIRTIQGILGNHKILSMNSYQESKGFPTRQTKSGVQLQPPHLLAERTRVPLVHALMRAQIHTNALYICSKINYPSDSQEFRELLKEVQLNDNKDNALFTYGAYYKLLSNAACEGGVSPIPQQTG